MPGQDPTVGGGAVEPLAVTVVRSPRRRKTAQARLVDGRLEVRIPARSSQAEEVRLVEEFRRRFERSRRAATLDLDERARRLARRFGLPEPTEIRWVSNQAHRWGSCTPATGVIRLSDRMAAFPPWVVDHVIVHELAHLVERGHDARFRALVAQYPLAERAEGYLIAKAGSSSADDDPLADDVDDERAPGRPPAEPGPGDADDPLHRWSDAPAPEGPGGSDAVAGDRDRRRRPSGAPVLPFPD